VDEISDVQDTDHLTFVHSCKSDFVIIEWTFGMNSYICMKLQVEKIFSVR